MVIRKADLGDIDALLANRIDFVKEMLGESGKLPEGYQQLTYDYMKDHLADDSLAVWLAIDDGKIVASAMVCFYQLLPLATNPTGNTGTILNVSTHPSYRRKGLATQLVKHIIQEARERRVGKLYLTASEMGKPVYEKLGFEMLTRDMVYKMT